MDDLRDYQWIHPQNQYQPKKSDDQVSSSYAEDVFNYCNEVNQSMITQDYTHQKQMTEYSQKWGGLRAMEFTLSSSDSDSSEKRKSDNNNEAATPSVEDVIIVEDDSDDVVFIPLQNTSNQEVRAGFFKPSASELHVASNATKEKFNDLDDRSPVDPEKLRSSSLIEKKQKMGETICENPKIDGHQLFGEEPCFSRETTDEDNLNIIDNMEHVTVTGLDIGNDSILDSTKVNDEDYIDKLIDRLIFDKPVENQINIRTNLPDLTNMDGMSCVTGPGKGDMKEINRHTSDKIDQPPFLTIQNSPTALVHNPQEPYIHTNCAAHSEKRRPIARNLSLTQQNLKSTHSKNSARFFDSCKDNVDEIKVHDSNTAAAISSPSINSKSDSKRTSLSDISELNNQFSDYLFEIANKKDGSIDGQQNPKQTDGCLEEIDKANNVGRMSVDEKQLKLLDKNLNCKTGATSNTGEMFNSSTTTADSNRDVKIAPLLHCNTDDLCLSGPLVVEGFARSEVKDNTDYLCCSGPLILEHFKRTEIEEFEQTETEDFERIEDEDAGRIEVENKVNLDSLFTLIKDDISEFASEIIRGKLANPRFMQIKEPKLLQEEDTSLTFLFGEHSEGIANQYGNKYCAPLVEFEKCYFGEEEFAVTKLVKTEWKEKKFATTMFYRQFLKYFWPVTTFSDMRDVKSIEALTEKEAAFFYIAVFLYYSHGQMTYELSLIIFELSLHLAKSEVFGQFSGKRAQEFLEKLTKSNSAGTQSPYSNVEQNSFRAVYLWRKFTKLSGFSPGLKCFKWLFRVITDSNIGQFNNACDALIKHHIKLREEELDTEKECVVNDIRSGYFDKPTTSTFPALDNVDRTTNSSSRRNFKRRSKNEYLIGSKQKKTKRSSNEQGSEVTGSSKTSISSEQQQTMDPVNIKVSLTTDTGVIYIPNCYFLKSEKPKEDPPAALTFAQLNAKIKQFNLEH